VSGLFRGGLGGGWLRRRDAHVADLIPRSRGPLAWELPEPVLFALDGRRDFLLRIDATLVNTAKHPLEIADARVADAPPAWDAPRAEWYEAGSVRRAVFRVVPWLPCTLGPGERRAGSRLLFVVPAERVPQRGVAKIPLVVIGEPFGRVAFEARASVPRTPRDAAAGI
jgi:hypothetical protein